MAAIQPLPAPIPRSPPSLFSLPNETIKKVALSCLQEFGIGLAIAGVTCFFVATPWGIGSIFLALGISTVLGLWLRLAEASEVAHEEFLQQFPNAQRQQTISRIFQELFRWTRALHFGTLYLGTAGILVHEAGHATAVTALFKNGRPSIFIHSFAGGGKTRYFTAKLSSLGNALGLRKALLLVTAAGALATLSVALLFMTVAHFLKKVHPQIAKYLNVAALVTVLNEFFYALSALSQKGSSHDFANLWQKGGIHPLLSALFLLGVPLFVKGTLCAIDYARNRF